MTSAEHVGNSLEEIIRELDRTGRRKVEGLEWSCRGEGEGNALGLGVGWDVRAAFQIIRKKFHRLASNVNLTHGFRFITVTIRARDRDRARDKSREIVVVDESIIR